MSSNYDKNSHYDPKNVTNTNHLQDEDGFIFVDQSEFIDLIETDLFDNVNINDGSCKQVKCKHCGSNEFAVGVGSYLTAIMCNKCSWQLVIHEG